MRKKSKGVTLVELIIVMGLTLVIMSAAYSFLNTSNKSTTNEDLKTMLQNEGNTIENKILNIATQAKGAINIYSNGTKIDDIKIANADLDSDGNINLNSIELVNYDKDSNSVIKLEDNVLTVTTDNKGTQILSENVLEMKVQPLNINQFTEDEKRKKSIEDISGYKFSFELGTKKGTTEAFYDISVQANFRNYDVEILKSKQEFNKLETAIINAWNKSESLISIVDAEKNQILNSTINLADNQSSIALNEIHLKQYDGSTIVMKFNDSKLTIGSKEFNNIVDFRIKVLDDNAETLKNSSGFIFLVTISEENTQNSNTQSTYEVIVKSKNN